MFDRPVTEAVVTRESLLAPYAQRAAESAGRLRPEKEHSFRTCFHRDRDRIVHGTSFRRLDGKTQVFLNGTGDHYRTRLTHTIEVASISRTVARALGLNEDLAEAIALAHDLGHPPFGHCGESTLDRLMKEYGGFAHNDQSLRVVELLEESYPQQPGLNLSYEVLEGLQKHHRELRHSNGTIHPHPSLEAQVANVADEIAYYSHDLEDGLESGLLLEPELSVLDLWQEASAQAETESGGTLESAGPRTHRKFILRCLINREVPAPGKYVSIQNASSAIPQNSNRAMPRSGTISFINSTAIPRSTRPMPRPAIRWKRSLTATSAIPPCSVPAPSPASSETVSRASSPTMSQG
jgi:dGTPase